MFIFFSGAMVPPVGSVKNSCGNRSSIKNGLMFNPRRKRDETVHVLGVVMFILPKILWKILL
jgi:hypothetical protein